MKRLLSPVTNSAGLSAAGLAVYAAVVMVYNATHNHGVIDVPVIIAAVAAVAALYTRQKVTPTADPKDGNGTPLRVPISLPPATPGQESGNVILKPPAAPEKTLIPPPQAGT
jgi:hypothetical protein